MTTILKRNKDVKHLVYLLYCLPVSSPEGAAMSRLPKAPILFFSLLFLFFSAVHAHARTAVLFDQGHGQRFLIERGGDLDLSLLAGTFRDLDHEVSTTSKPITGKILDGIDVLMISGAFQPYTPEEIEAVTRFIERGGAVCITLHIAPPLFGLLNRLGVEHSNGVIREEEGVINGDPINFRVTRLESHPLFQGMAQFSLYGVWALLDARAGVRSIARTSPSAWIDLNGNGRFDQGDARQSFTVAVAGEAGKGRFVVFGDDAVFQNKFLKGDNLILARNLAAWLAGGRQPSPPKNLVR